MSTVETKKHGVMSKEQKVFLIQFLESNPELKSGKFTQHFTFKTAQSLWKEVAEALNAMPGSKKEWEKWRKTWHDMKNAVKSKGAVIKRHQAGTGGGPPIQAELSNEDERILGLIAPVAIEGHHVLESQAVFFDEAGSCQEVEIKHNYDSTPSIENKENLKGNSEQGANKNSEIQSRRTRVQRLNNTIAVSEQMVAQMEKKITVRRNYFTRKLQIMKTDCIVKKRIASALEIMPEHSKNVKMIKKANKISPELNYLLSVNVPPFHIFWFLNDTQHLNFEKLIFVFIYFYLFQVFGLFFVF